LGYVLGVLLYDLFIHRFDSESAVWYYVTVIVLAVVMAIVSLWLHDIIIILATGIVGAYVSVKMVGEMTGKFPDEATIARMIKAGKFESMPWEVYVFMVGIVVLAVVGLTIQFCFFAKDIKKRKQTEKEKENEYYNMI